MIGTLWSGECDLQWNVFESELTFIELRAALGMSSIALQRKAQQYAKIARKETSREIKHCIAVIGKLPLDGSSSSYGFNLSAQNCLTC